MKTTTEKFQIKPDFYKSVFDCNKNKKVKHQTNKRYKNFNQTLFTAGDKEQFIKYLLLDNGVEKQVDLSSNVFKKTQKTQQTNIPIYQDINSDCLLNTFDYIFNKFKKGIYVKIQNNKLVVFLPFSKANFINEWYEKIKVLTPSEKSRLLSQNIVSSFTLIDFDFKEYGDNIIKFYSKSSNDNIKTLSNFALIPVKIENRNYISGEHAFHGEKYFQISKQISNSERKQELLNHCLKFQCDIFKTPLDAKKAGGKSKHGLALTDQEIKFWITSSIDVQFKICEYKFNNNETIRKVLSEYSDYYFLHQENKANTNSIWSGRIKDDELIGQNKLGKIWMSFNQQHEQIKNVDTNENLRTYENIHEILETITNMEGKYKFNKNIVSPPEKWYANNCLFRYDSTEGDTNNTTMKNLLIELCEQRNIPDTEFFINRRDFPLLMKNLTEPYDNIWGSNVPLVSHKYHKYMPILSMSCSDENADLMMPTHEDWTRVQLLENKYFEKSCDNTYDFDFVKWENKKEIALFRGGTTGCGTTVETNQRLKLADISHKQPLDDNGNKYLDAGITNWNLRVRKLKGSDYLTTIYPEDFDFDLVERMPRNEQSKYKYIINVDGHVKAFRLSSELNSGSVILLVDSKWKLWYSDMLIPYEHYVPVKSDMTDLIEKVKWCRKNDSTCKEIVQNAKNFYSKYLSKQGILDFMQKLFVNMKNTTGNYKYNSEAISDLIYRKELVIERPYPELKNDYQPGPIPKIERSYGLLKGIQFTLNMLYDKHNDLDVVLSKQKQYFANKLGKIYKSNFQDFVISIKKSSDPSKIKEHVHENYIGINYINELSKEIPNFCFTFGLYTDSKNQTCIMNEYIKGDSLDSFIKSKQFTISKFNSIVFQILLATQYAYEKYGFIHYDLTPWNIIIKEEKEEKEFTYKIQNNIYKVKSNVIPVIIDYGKSSIIDNNVYIGMFNLFKPRVFIDMYSFILTTLDKLSEINLSIVDKNYISKLYSYFSEFEIMTKTHSKHITDYKKLMIEFKKSKSDSIKSKIIKLKTIINTENEEIYNNTISKIKVFKKYDNLIYLDNKGFMENKSPLDFIRFINKNLKHDVKIEKTDKLISYNNHNPTQVYYYIVNRNVNKRIESFMIVFSNIFSSTLPKTQDIFTSYYVYQSFYQNLTGIINDLKNYLDSINMTSSFPKYKEKYDDTIKFFHKYYIEDVHLEKTIVFDTELYDLDSNINLSMNLSLDNPVYKTMIETYDTKESLLYLKNIVNYVLYTKHKLELPSEHHEKYKKLFEVLYNDYEFDNIVINSVKEYFTILQNQ